MNPLSIRALFSSKNKSKKIKVSSAAIFSSPGQSPGRAIVLPPASALVAALAKMLKFLCDGQGAVR